ncbi:MAG: hypothetical protein IKK42_08330 [Oscillospiraceae bacterium]|nr:hypothetical protein [Oscillospiraceae bacterium]
MDKYEFLKLCGDYGGVTREMYIDCGQDIIDTYHRLIDNEEITLFHGFYCLVSSRYSGETYALVPYTGTQQELQNDPAFKEYHSWRALAERKECDSCGKVYFSAGDDDGCPYCRK